MTSLAVAALLALSAAGSADDSEDYENALALAEQGDAFGQNYLGLMYDIGQGVPQDYKAAVKWYSLAAEQGNAKAQSNLGVMYVNGQGVPQDYKAAVKWYSLAAEQGRADALRGRPFNSSGMDRDEIRINAAT